MKVGLYFGSFNPVHIGHLLIANHFVEFTDSEEVWFVVSPQNPLKKKDSLLDANLRLKMVEAAVAPCERLKASDIEFNLPQPSYTIDTLKFLKKKYPWYDLVVIMGSDTLEGIVEWKEYYDILSGFKLYVYMRRDFPAKTYKKEKNVTFFEFPYLDISATYVRDLLKKGKSVQFLVPDKVLKLLAK